MPLAVSALGCLALVPLAASARPDTVPLVVGSSIPDTSRSSAAGEAYYQFLVGKICRLDGQLDDAAEHLNRAADADNSSTIRKELAETYLKMGDLAKAVEQARLATKQNPKDLEARRTLAEAYIATGQGNPDNDSSTAMAISEIRAILELAPGDNDMRLTLGRLLLQADHPEEALEQFRTLRSAGADPTQTGILIGRSLLRDGRKDEAESELRSVLQVSPRNYEALLTLSQLAEEREDWANAAVYYGRLVEIRPSDNAVRARLGYTLLRANKTGESITALREACARNPSDRPTRELLVRALRAAGMPGQALHELDVLLEYRPDDPRLLIQAARLHEDRGEIEPALECYRRAASAAEMTNAGNEPLELKAKQSLTLAIAALEIDAHHPSAALHTLEGIPRDDSDLGLDGVVLRVRALAASGNPVEAAGAATEFQRLAADDPRAPLLLLEAHLAGSIPHDVDKAMADFHPDSRPPRETVAAAELLRLAGNGKTGIEILERAVATHPQDASLHFALGALQERLGNTRKAESYMERALELDPKEARALNYLGYSLADRGKDLVRAEALIRRALEIDPDNGAYLDSLGWALLKLNRIDESETALVRAADLVAGDATVREHLGDLYEKKGDLERALAEWKTAQGLRPDDPERLRRKILRISRARR